MNVSVIRILWLSAIVSHYQLVTFLWLLHLCDCHSPCQCFCHSHCFCVWLSLCLLLSTQCHCSLTFWLTSHVHCLWQWIWLTPSLPLSVSITVCLPAIVTPTVSVFLLEIFYVNIIASFTVSESVTNTVTNIVSGTVCHYHFHCCVIVTSSLWLLPLCDCLSLLLAVFQSLSL